MTQSLSRALHERGRPTPPRVADLHRVLRWVGVAVLDVDEHRRLTRGGGEPVAGHLAPGARAGRDRDGGGEGSRGLGGWSTIGIDLPDASLISVPARRSRGDKCSIVQFLRMIVPRATDVARDEGGARSPCHTVDPELLSGWVSRDPICGFRDGETAGRSPRSCAGHSEPRAQDPGLPVSR